MLSFFLVFIQIVASIAVLSGIGLFSILLYRAFAARKYPDLCPWHESPLILDRVYKQNVSSFEELVQADHKFLDQIYRAAQINIGSTFDKYLKSSESTPYRDGLNLNASFEVYPIGKPKGGVFLVHGLCDSPYHLRSVAESFTRQGYYVSVLRLPNIGTIPGALLHARWEQWYQAVELGIALTKKKISSFEQQEFMVGGFSIGGALTLRYVLMSIMQNEQSVPSKLFMIAPCLGINPLANIAHLHQLISWIPFFKKSSWLNIKPEYDPFKYNSFTQNAAAQANQLTKANWKLIKALQEDRAELNRFPPMYTFQSITDDTVSVSKLIDLYTCIGSPSSELMMFDINRAYLDFMREDFKHQFPEMIINTDGFHSKLLVVKNQINEKDNSYSRSVSTYQVSKHYGKPKLQEIADAPALEWPFFVYTLSHVSLPIAAHDAVYGQEGLLAKIAPKGEVGVLIVDNNDLTRLRYNPFYRTIDFRIAQILNANSAPDHSHIISTQVVQSSVAQAASGVTTS